MVSDLTVRECSSELGNKIKVDKNSPEQIVKQNEEKQCKYFFESQKYMRKWKPQETNIPNFDLRNFCYSNLTLSFHIIDSLENYDFIQKIMPSYNNTTKESKAFIIDSANERSYALTKEATFINYMEFIDDFYSKTLETIQRTTFIEVKEKVPLISFAELATQSFTEVSSREHENVSFCFKCYP